MRDFDKEAKTSGDRLYNYDFDDVVRHFALKTFSPFLRIGPTLEIGCHEGGMSRLLLDRNADLTVIDAAESALDVARQRLPIHVKFVRGKIESATFQQHFETIFMINVLEHVDDAVIVLQRARELLTDSGRVFILVPNANAPSRQIAVHMGLITHNQAVTEAEYQNGHRRTYTLDTLQRDLRTAELSIDQIGGIIFKGLANYQMDKALASGIISPEYLEASYEVGKIYPDLCASLYAVCSNSLVSAA